MAWKVAFFVDYDDCSGVVAVLLWVVMEWAAFGVPVGCGGVLCGLCGGLVVLC